MANSSCSPDANGIAISSSPPPMVAPVPQLKPSSSGSDVSPQASSDSQAAAPDNRNIVRRKLTGYVGFANLPNQWHRKSVRKGFNFNVMVVGELPSLFFMFMRHGTEHVSFNLSRFPQVNPASESRLLSTLCSTPPCTLPRSARARASTSSPRPSVSSLSAPISRRRGSVFA